MCPTHGKRPVRHCCEHVSAAVRAGTSLAVVVGQLQYSREFPEYATTVLTCEACASARGWQPGFFVEEFLESRDPTVTGAACSTCCDELARSNTPL